MPITKIEFVNLCARTINKTFSGEPLELTPLLNAVDFLETLAETDEHRNTLRAFLLTKLQGAALECLPAAPGTIKDITDALKQAIKPESSKVVSGRMLALKADSSNPEALAESFKRSLILEGIFSGKANEMTVDKTIELCRSNTTSSVVKSVLASSQFENFKDVIAKFIVESRTETTEKQVLAFKSQHKNNNNQNHNNNYNKNNWNGKKKFNNNNGRNNNYQNGRGQGRNNNYQNRGRNNNYNGHNNNNNGYNQRRQNNNNNNVYYAENEQAPPSGAAQTQQVQMNQVGQRN